MKDPALCAELVERLLNLKVSHIEYPEFEKIIAPYFSSKGVRMDVYLKDSDKVIDVEMQSYPQEALPLRMRYYQSMIDADNLLKGQGYEDLKASYIVFICTDDPFLDERGKKYGLPCYTLTTKCHEAQELNFNDKIKKVIYNASGYEKESDAKIRDFLRFVYTNDPSEDDFSIRLTKRVENLKQSEGFKEAYATMGIWEMDIRRDERKASAVEAAVIAVREFNIDPKLAAEKMKAPLEDVMESLGMNYEKPSDGCEKESVPV